MLKAFLSLIIIVLSGCAQNEIRSYQKSKPDNLANYDLEELLNYGAKMSAMSPASRSEQCRSLLKYQGESAEISVPLHQMFGRLLSDSCGDIPRILDNLSSINLSNQVDENVKKQISINMEALKRMNSAAKKLAALERKQKTVQNMVESKGGSAAKKDETQLLKEKLEAIRSMEKQIDETSDGN
jgi:hypothetical protein